MATLNDFLTQQEFTKGVNTAIKQVTPFQKSITIEGDGNTYYPVVFQSNRFGLINEFEISKYVYQPANSDGYLRLKFEVGSGGYGTFPSVLKVIYLLQSVRNFVGGIVNGHNKHTVWLLGGGRSYTVYSKDYDMNGKVVVYYEKTLLPNNMGATEYVEPKTIPDAVKVSQVDSLIAHGYINGTNSTWGKLFDLSKNGITYTRPSTGTYQFFDGTLQCTYSDGYTVAAQSMRNDYAQSIIFDQNNIKAYDASGALINAPFTFQIFKKY